ncbi:uncharacterized protein [Diadema antillarum]|uniref:uncharacterized protein n=1 Tax=Diadema antillarum TaxID=105358 RepID=UPI003A85B619
MTYCSPRSTSMEARQTLLPANTSPVSIELTFNGGKKNLSRHDAISAIQVKHDSTVSLKLIAPRQPRYRSEVFIVLDSNSSSISGPVTPSTDHNNQVPNETVVTTPSPERDHRLATECHVLEPSETLNFSSESDGSSTLKNLSVQDTNEQREHTASTITRKARGGNLLRRQKRVKSYDDDHVTSHAFHPCSAQTVEDSSTTPSNQAVDESEYVCDAHGATCAVNIASIGKHSSFDELRKLIHEEKEWQSSGRQDSTKSEVIEDITVDATSLQVLDTIANKIESFHTSKHISEPPYVANSDNLYSSDICLQNSHEREYMDEKGARHNVGQDNKRLDVKFGQRDGSSDLSDDKGSFGFEPHYEDFSGYIEGKEYFKSLPTFHNLLKSVEETSPSETSCRQKSGDQEPVPLNQTTQMTDLQTLSEYAADANTLRSEQWACPFPRTSDSEDVPTCIEDQNKVLENMRRKVKARFRKAVISSSDSGCQDTDVDHSSLDEPEVKHPNAVRKAKSSEEYTAGKHRNHLSRARTTEPKPSFEEPTMERRQVLAGFIRLCSSSKELFSAPIGTEETLQAIMKDECLKPNRNEVKSESRDSNAGQVEKNDASELVHEDRTSKSKIEPKVKRIDLLEMESDTQSLRAKGSEDMGTLCKPTTDSDIARTDRTEIKLAMPTASSPHEKSDHLVLQHRSKSEDSGRLGNERSLRYKNIAPETTSQGFETLAADGLAFSDPRLSGKMQSGFRRRKLSSKRSMGSVEEKANRRVHRHRLSADSSLPPVSTNSDKDLDSFRKSCPPILNVGPHSGEHLTQNDAQTSTGIETGKGELRFPDISSSQGVCEPLENLTQSTVNESASKRSENTHSSFDHNPSSILSSTSKTKTKDSAVSSTYTEPQETALQIREKVKTNKDVCDSKQFTPPDVDIDLLDSEVQTVTKKLQSVFRAKRSSSKSSSSTSHQKSLSPERDQPSLPKKDTLISAVRGRDENETKAPSPSASVPGVAVDDADIDLADPEVQKVTSKLQKMFRMKRAPAKHSNSCQGKRPGDVQRNDQTHDDEDVNMLTNYASNKIEAKNVSNTPCKDAPNVHETTTPMNAKPQSQHTYPGVTYAGNGRTAPVQSDATRAAISSDSAGNNTSTQTTLKNKPTNP